MLIEYHNIRKYKQLNNFWGIKIRKKEVNLINCCQDFDGPRIVIILQNIDSLQHRSNWNLLFDDFKRSKYGGQLECLEFNDPSTPYVSFRVKWWSTHNVDGPIMFFLLLQNIDSWPVQLKCILLGNFKTFKMAAET